MSIKGQGHSLTLVIGHSDFKVKCLTFGLYTEVSDSGPHGPLVCLCKKTIELFPLKVYAYSLYRVLKSWNKQMWAVLYLHKIPFWIWTELSKLGDADKSDGMHLCWNLKVSSILHELSLNSLTTEKQTTKFPSANFQKMLSPSYIILIIQRLEDKQCRPRWGGSLWSTLFANSAIFVTGI